MNLGVVLMWEITSNIETTLQFIVVYLRKIWLNAVTLLGFGII